MLTRQVHKYVIRFRVEVPHIGLRHFCSNSVSQGHRQILFNQITSGFRKPEDFYQLTTKEIIKRGGDELLKDFKNPHDLLSHFIPEYDWLPWMFTACPKNYWQDISNIKKYVNWAATQLSIKDLSDWYRVSTKDIKNLKGSWLLIRHNDSLQELLRVVYPDYEWLPWKFIYCPRNYWDSIDNQRKYVDWVGKQLGINEMSDWYKYTLKDFASFGSSGLIYNHYNSSLYLLLSTIYNEYEWLPWRFLNAPRNFWSYDKNKKWFLDWAGKHLGVKEYVDWYNVDINELKKLGGFALLSMYKFNLLRLLSSIYPEYSWRSSLNSLSSGSKKSQSILKDTLKSLFPHDEILEDYRHSQIMTHLGYPLELDIYYPSLKLALEYQGKQHFEYVNIFHNDTNSLEEFKKRDAQKEILCKQNGITLIKIPYWWDKKKDSLVATIHRERPDLFNTAPIANPIPSNLPTPASVSITKKLCDTNNILMLCTNWDLSMNPEGWWMSEKYDGVRLYWNGREFFSRQGNLVKVPEFIKKHLPQVPLDGELWTQYGLYQDAVSLCNSINTEKWKKAKFWVFDLPNNTLPYEKRIALLKEMKSRSEFPPFIQIVEPVLCTGKEHLTEYFNAVKAKNGEGVVLREQSSFYTSGRSYSMKKYKNILETEVKVLENKFPHGLKCQQLLNNHPVFVSIYENFKEAKTLKKDDIITVKYFGINVYKTLQYPQFFRKRIIY